MKYVAITCPLLMLALVASAFAQGRTPRLTQSILQPSLQAQPQVQSQPQIQMQQQVQFQPQVQTQAPVQQVVVPQQAIVVAPVLPAVAPRVACSGGLVTVDAENSTLVSVLRAIARCSGAGVDMPADVGASRVFARLGPIKPAEMFPALLDGSVDYVIVGSSQDPERVRMVIVRQRESTNAAQGQGNAYRAQPVAMAAPVTPTFTDDKGVERLASGLTPEEANLTPEELALKFEAARAQQRIDEGLPLPESQ